MPWPTIRTFLFGILYNKAKESRRQFAREARSSEIDGTFDVSFAANGSWAIPPVDPERLFQGENTDFVKNSIGRTRWIPRIRVFLGYRETKPRKSTRI